MTREERIAYLESIGVGYDGNVDYGSDEEFIHNSQRRAAPGIGSDGQRTESAHGWDGSTRADSGAYSAEGELMDTRGALKPYEGGWLPASDIMGRPVGNNRGGFGGGEASAPSQQSQAYFADPSQPARNRQGWQGDDISPMYGYQAVPPVDYYRSYDPVYAIDYFTGRPMGGPVRASDMARGGR